MSKLFTPRPYGAIITDFVVSNERGAVLVPMGMGKTVSTLNAIAAVLMIEDAPVLVLAPLRVARTTWPDEAAKWAHLAHLRVMPVVGSEKERRAALRVRADIYTSNYENLPWLVELYGDKWPFRWVVLDESTKVKGFRLRQGTARAKALGRVAHTLIKRITLLTGTPAPNGLLDLWGQLWFVDKGVRLGRTFDGFKSRWFRKSHDGYGSIPFDHAQREIQDVLRDVCLSLDAKDWFDLKDPIVNNIFVDLPIKARALYNDMEKEMFMQLEEHEVEAFGAAARTVKCLQICNGSAYLNDSKEWKEIHDVKIQALDEIIEEAGGMPVLVAYNFKSDLARLLAAFPKGRQLDANPRTISDWNAGTIPVLFAHPASAGHGLNLQDGGNILVFFAHDWNLENRLQIIERIGPTRQMQAGHDRPMFIYNIIARDTVDEMVIERVNTKREIQDILLDAMKTRRL